MEVCECILNPLSSVGSPKFPICLFSDLRSPCNISLYDTYIQFTYSFLRFHSSFASSISFTLYLIHQQIITLSLKYILNWPFLISFTLPPKATHHHLSPRPLQLPCNRSPLLSPFSLYYLFLYQQPEWSSQIVRHVLSVFYSEPSHGLSSHFKSLYVSIHPFPHYFTQLISCRYSCQSLYSSRWPLCCPLNTLHLGLLHLLVMFFPQTSFAFYSHFLQCISPYPKGFSLAIL